MSDTVTVRYVMAETVCEETWTAPRITTQELTDQRTLVHLWHGDEVTERITYGRDMRIHHVIGTAREDA